MHSPYGIAIGLLSIIAVLKNFALSFKSIHFLMLSRWRTCSFTVTLVWVYVRVYDQTIPNTHHYRSERVKIYICTYMYVLPRSKISVQSFMIIFPMVECACNDSFLFPPFSRRFDIDHYLCCLLLPHHARAASFALRAFNIELAQVNIHVLYIHHV